MCKTPVDSRTLTGDSSASEELVSEEILLKWNNLGHFHVAFCSLEGRLAEGVDLVTAQGG